MLSFRPRHPWQKALLLFVPRQSWLRILHSYVLAIPRSGVLLCDLRSCFCMVGGPSDPPVFGHENTALFCGCGLAGTPLHVPLLGLGGMECSVYVPRLCTWGPSNSHPTPLFPGEGPFSCCSLAILAGGCYTISFPPLVARASCCACNCALGLAGWAAQCSPLHPTCPTCGRRDSCMVGVPSGVATSPYIWPAVPG